jgi:hypothetical protein
MHRYSNPLHTMSYSTGKGAILLCIQVIMISTHIYDKACSGPSSREHILFLFMWTGPVIYVVTFRVSTVSNMSWDTSSGVCSSRESYGNCFVCVLHVGCEFHNTPLSTHKSTLGNTRAFGSVPHETTTTGPPQPMAQHCSDWFSPKLQKKRISDKNHNLTLLKLNFPI